MPRVKDINGNATIHGRLQRLRMQYFGSKMRKFGGFIKADGFNVLRVRTNAGIGGHHSVYIGPDLDGIGVDAGADNRCCVIGAAAT